MKLDFRPPTQFGPKIKNASEAASSPQKMLLYPTEERKDLRAANLHRDKVKVLAHLLASKGMAIQ